MDIKKIFISYSWDNETHKQWTLNLANQLEEYSELHITLDQYDLDSFSDKNHFMESGVFDNDYIILIVTPEYVHKSNNRSGGVGIETKLASSRHWEESLTLGVSKIIPILRSGTELPNYIKEKFYIDFRDDEKLSSSFEQLIKHITNSAKSIRPTKKKSLQNRPIHKDLTKNEEFLKINHRKRKLVFDKSKTTDFSSGNRIKFELWETRSPAIDHYLFIFDGVILRPTIQRMCELIKSEHVSIRRLTVLRPTRGEKGYIRKLLKENGCTFHVEEITFSDYIWDYCIEDEAKVVSKIYKQKFFIDQPLVSIDEGMSSKGPAFEFLKKILNSEVQSSAKLIIAPGGTGKTTLCQYVANEYQNPENAISVFIQSEELRNISQTNGHENIIIESVYDLYEVHSQVLSEHGENNLTYNKTTFEVALITGRMVLVIDGMDEIISLFPERFNLDSFLNSIDELNRQLASCKIVITSRNDVFDLNLMEKYEYFDKYCLLGFDESACESYLSRRFRHLEQADTLKRKVLGSIKPLIDSDENQRVLPFIVDLLSTLAEESDDEQDTVNFALSFDGKKYESNEDITDYLVYSVLRREWQRQKIEIPIEDVLEIFLEVSSTHKDIFSKADFEDIVSIFCSGNSNDLLTKMLRNPLIVIDGEQCRFKYDFISDYFRSLYIIKSINLESVNDDFIKLIAKNAYGDSEVMSSATRYFQKKPDELSIKCKSIITKIKSNIKPAEVMAVNDINFRAIGFLVKIVSLSSPTNNSKESFTNLLRQLFDDSLGFKNLAIYGDNMALDLDNLIVTDSKFIGYKNFSKSKFSGTKIKNCYFDACYSENTPTNFSKDIFDSCRLGDLETAIEVAQEKNEKERELIEGELRSFLNSFFHKGTFTDKKTSYIKFSTRVKNMNRSFLNKLLREGIVQVKVEKSDETYYEISPSYQDSVYGFLSNNKIDRRIESIISLI